MYMTDYPKSATASRLTKSEIDIAKQFGVRISEHKIVQPYRDYRGREHSVSLLDGFAYAKNITDIRKWLNRIGATPIYQVHLSREQDQQPGENWDDSRERVG